VWETTVRVAVSAVSTAAPDQTWALMCSPEAWSARPVNCPTFDIPAADAVAAPGPDADSPRLRLYLGAADGRATASVFLVASEVPGETICLRTPSGRATWQLSVQPASRGTRLQIAGTFVVLRQAKLDVEREQRREFKAWLQRLCAIAEGRAPWPADGMADRVRRACSTGVPMTEAVEASASVRVDAPPAAVSRALLGTPEFLRATQAEQVEYCGYVPGARWAGGRPEVLRLPHARRHPARRGEPGRGILARRRHRAPGDAAVCRDDLPLRAVGRWDVGGDDAALSGEVRRHSGSSP
jgi:hypothetical protein